VLPFQLLMPRTDSTADCVSVELTVDNSALQILWGCFLLGKAIFNDFKGNLIAATAGTDQVSFKSSSS